MVCLSTPLTAQNQSDAELLNMSLDELMDIQVVNVSKLNLENLSEVPSAVTIVTSEQIENSGAKNMEEVMRMVAGFDVVRNGNNANTSFGVRGLFSTEGTNNKILFMIDDHPVRSVFFNDASVFIGNLPLDNIKQIEIIRGPGSTLFGAGAFLGVINVRTKDADRNAEISVAGGSFSTMEGSGLYTFRKGDDLKVTLSGKYYQTDGADVEIKSDVSGEVIDPVGATVGMYTGPTTSIAPGQLNYDRTTTNFNLRANFKDFYLLGGLLNSNDRPPVGVYEALTRNNDVDNEGSYVELGYKTSLFNDQGEVLVKTYYDHYSYDARTDLWTAEGSLLWNHFVGGRYFTDPTLTKAPSFYADGEAQMYETIAKNDDIGLELNFAYNFQSYVNVLVGGMYETHRLFDAKTIANGNVFFESDGFMTFGSESFVNLEAFGGVRDISENYNWIRNQERTVGAGFGQADFNMKNILKTFSLEHFSIIAGARYDYYSDAGGSLNPRAALLIAPMSKVYFKALYGEAFRAPSFVELYQQNNSLFLGDANLDPETIVTRELVAGYKIDKKVNVTLTYFNTRISDNIQLRRVADPNSFGSQYANAGGVKTSGIEAEVRYSFKEGAYLQGSFTYQEVLDISKDTIRASNYLTFETLESVQGDFNPGKVPTAVFNLTGNYPLTKNINLNFSANYIGERNRTEATEFELDAARLPTGNIVSVDPRDAIDSRLILNASIRLTDFDFAQGFEFQLTGHNILDATNYNPTQTIRGDDLLREGANWRARLVYKF